MMVVLEKHKGKQELKPVLPFWLLSGTLLCLPWLRLPQALVFLFILLQVLLSTEEKREGGRVYSKMFSGSGPFWSFDCPTALTMVLLLSWAALYV